MTARGWVALAGALPSLPMLDELWLEGSTGLGSEGAAALAAAVPNCPRLQELRLIDCELLGEQQSTLEALERPASDPRGTLTVSFEDE